MCSNLEATCQVVHLGVAKDIGPTGLIVGRGEGVDIRLVGGLVSRAHARFFYDDSRLWVEDLSSRNGVVVNGKKIAKPTELSHGDTVTIGLDVLRVVHPSLIEHAPRLSTLPPPTPRGGQRFAHDSSDEATVATVECLTEREREVLQLIVLGHTQAEIGKRLFISVKTVESHRAHIADKLGCETRAELVSYALAAGLLRPM